ncbi:MAG: glycosyl transferase group 1 [Chlorobi bacterium OLB5]|nr:MAG: glycosyl transferase group 1 [Chlorobi bacterium OLB5]
MNKIFGVSFISSFIPRQCGIATFTNDLSASFRNLNNGILMKTNITAINDIPEGYKYPPEVKFEIKDKSINDFKEAAYYLNLSDKDIINLQHEFGLYGGEAGSHILYLLENLKKPVITTLHTVLEHPNEDQLKVISEISGYSSYIVVQSKKAYSMLSDIYSVPAHKIYYIPHGAHDVQFLDTTYYKDKFRFTEKKVLLTFGLLSPGKGIEDVINSLAEVVKTNPDVVYIILGATHPHVKKQFGESYRNSLENLVKKLGLENNVIFINRFVDTEELLEFLLMSDIYISPYHNMDQIVSGTLTYALASGKAVISTPYWYAVELLKDERGILYQPQNVDSLSEAIKGLLNDESKRNRFRRNAYEAGRSMIWAEVANRYYELFRKAAAEYTINSTSLVPAAKYKMIPALPDVNLTHLINLTDSTGIIQHSVFSVPNRNEGYCIDDNSRALLVIIMNKYLFHDPAADALLNTYLSFIHYAYNKNTGLFRNFMSYDRKWLEESGSEDSNGRTLFVLGYFIKNAENHSHLALCKMLFDSTLKNMEKFTSLRAISHIIMGCIFYLHRFSGARDVKRICRKLLERLNDEYSASSGNEWKWFEDFLTYDNARLPQALLMGGIYLKNSNYLYNGLEALNWYVDIIFDKEKNYISLIGNDGWYFRGKDKSKFDQQPLEIVSIIDACYQAYLISEDMEWINKSGISFSWFLGNNDRQEPLYDFTTGGCYDGLTSAITNQNQGAESTVSWLTSLHRMYRIRQELQVE